LKGAELSLEGTSTGFRGKFAQAVRNVQEDLGTLVTRLFETKKNADQLFDEAKESTEKYDKSLTPLLSRYDELKGKTKLNNVEQNELQSVIQKIVSIVPEAATEINKYGLALDINKAKVISFLENNKKFLQERDSAAIDEQTSNLRSYLKTIEDYTKNQALVQKEIDANLNSTSKTSRFIVEDGRRVIKENTSSIRVLQQQALETAEKLSTKYGIELPKDIQKGVEGIKGAVAALATVNVPDKKIIGNGDDPDKNAEAEKEAQRKYEQLLDKAKSFHEKLEDLKFQSQQAAKSSDQKEIDAATHKYNEILKEYDDLVKKINAADRSMLGPRSAIVEAQEQELNAIREKQRKEHFEKEQKEIHDNLSKSYAEQLQENERFYEEKKSIEAKRFIAQEIDKKTLDANLAHIDVDAKNAQLVIAETYADKTVTIEGKIVPAAEQAVKDVTRIKKEALETQTKDALAAYDKQQAELKLREELGKRAAEAKLKTRLTVAVGSKDLDGQLKAQKELNEFQRQMKLVALDKEKHDALQSLTDTGIARIEKENEILNAIAEQKRAVNAETDAADEEIANTVHQNKLARVAEIGQATMSMFSSINQFITNIENRQLQQELARNEKKRKDIKKQLDSKLLSQEQYSKAVQAIDEEEEKHKKQIARDQAKREKALNLMSAVMTTALAIIGFLTAKPIGPWNFVEAAIAGALGGAQIGVIASTPLPSLGTGGLIKEGPYHKDPEKGLHVVDPSTGKTQMLLERDEGVLKGSAMRSNETFTVTGTPSQIASGLNSMYGGVNWEGGALITNMRSMKPAQINPNMPRIMEMGGVVRSSSSPAGNGSGFSEELLKQMIAEQRMTREALKEFNTELSATVSLKQLKDTEKLYDAAKKSSAINQN
jgi:hypothetical protein